MVSEWLNVKLRTTRAVRGLDLKKVVPLRAFSRIKTVRDEERPFQYIVQVETRHRRTGESIYRQITVSESERGILSEILQDAADTIMGSPIAAREELVRVEIIKAQRYRG